MNDPFQSLRILKLRFIYQCKNWNSWNEQTKRGIWTSLFEGIDNEETRDYYNLAGKVIIEKYSLTSNKSASILQILELFDLAEKYLNNKAFI